MKAKISCKYCSFTFKDKTVLEDHMTNEHSEICTVCHMKFKSNERLKDHKHFSSIKHHAVLENIMNCAYCDFTCADKGVLKKHTKKDHTTNCKKYFTTFRDQEARNKHMRDTMLKNFYKAWWFA